MISEFAGFCWTKYEIKSGEILLSTLFCFRRPKIAKMPSWGQWIRVRISLTFSVLRKFSVLFRTSTALLRPLYFDLLSNMDFLLVEKHRSKYSLVKTLEVKSVGRSTEKVELMRTRELYPHMVKCNCNIFTNCNCAMICE